MKTGARTKTKVGMATIFRLALPFIGAAAILTLVLTTVSWARGGLLTADVFRAFFALLPALILGGLTGTRLVSKVSERMFRYITLGIVMVAAAIAIVNGLRGLL